jgi:hypothetical protein
MGFIIIMNVRQCVFLVISYVAVWGLAQCRSCLNDIARTGGSLCTPFKEADDAVFLIQGANVSRAKEAKSSLLRISVFTNISCLDTTTVMTRGELTRNNRLEDPSPTKALLPLV